MHLESFLPLLYSFSAISLGARFLFPNTIDSCILLTMVDAYLIEKRRYPRHPISSPVRYHPVEKSKSVNGSITVDISEGGICFLSGDFIPRGAEVQFSIPVTNQVFQILGKTTYSTLLPNIHFYRTGVEFQNVPDSYKKKLTEEISQVREYQKTLSDQLGYEISEKEAAVRWTNDCAKHFSISF